MVANYCSENAGHSSSSSSSSQAFKRMCLITPTPQIGRIWQHHDHPRRKDVPHKQEDGFVPSLPSPSPSLPPLPLAPRLPPPRPPPGSAPPPKLSRHRHSPCICRRAALSRPPAAVVPQSAAGAAAGAAAKAREDYNDNLNATAPPSLPLHPPNALEKSDPPTACRGGHDQHEQRRF